MADAKISALPAATTPLAGTEVLPVVQGGTTDQVSVANLTAGRAISALSATLSNGNLVVSTAGKGITTGGATALGLGTNNAVTAVTIDTSNNVGINTPGNPNARFEVFDGAVRFGNASGNGFLFADGTATLVGSLSNHPLHLYTNNTKRAEIDTSGNISAGVGALATNATNGFLYIPTCPGVPTGTPTTKTGLAPLVVDSTNNKLYVYVGGSWVAMN